MLLEKDNQLEILLNELKKEFGMITKKEPAIKESATKIESIEGCHGYKILNDPNRKTSHGKDKMLCDVIGKRNASPDWQGPNWYRVSSNAGSKIATTKVSKYQCNTNAPGYISSNIVMPTKLGESTYATVSFVWGYIKTVQITIKNCGDFYTYYLPNAPEGGMRYCTSA